MSEKFPLTCQLWFLHFMNLTLLWCLVMLVLFTFDELIFAYSHEWKVSIDLSVMILAFYEFNIAMVFCLCFLHLMNWYLLIATNNYSFHWLVTVIILAFYEFNIAMVFCLCFLHFMNWYLLIATSIELSLTCHSYDACISWINIAMVFCHTCAGTLI